MRLIFLLSASLLMLAALAVSCSSLAALAADLPSAATGTDQPPLFSAAAERAPKYDEFCLAHYAAYLISPSERAFWRLQPFADALLYPTTKVMCVPAKLAARVVDPIIARLKRTHKPQPPAPPQPRPPVTLQLEARPRSRQVEPDSQPQESKVPSTINPMELESL